MKRQGWIERLAAGADLQGEATPGQPLLELFGDRRILIEHHKGVTEYGKERIMIRVRFGCICINGMDLELACMTAQQLVITGQVFSVELMRR